MGELVKIVDFVCNLIVLSGFQEWQLGGIEGDIEICFIGLWLGEKFYEEFLFGLNFVGILYLKIMCVYEVYFFEFEIVLVVKCFEQVVWVGNVCVVCEVFLEVVDGFC